ncbi:hypothetical protein ANO11243_051520 [Dothideomycetidae sp. 11243]|nr:hypothetical protein ANO11243_051520 [fungal sp. No.11243]
MTTPIVPNAAKKPGAPSTPYFHNGRALASAPLTVQLYKFLCTAYCFIGLYLTTLFSFDPTESARSSPFALRNRSPDDVRRGKFPQPKFFGGGGGGGGGKPDGRGPGGGGGGGGRPVGKRIGTVDQVRGPECGSCRG